VQDVKGRWTSVTPRVFEEPRHVLHPLETFCRRATEILGDQSTVDAGIDELKDAADPRSARRWKDRPVTSRTL
jgi:hypothetical protein